MRRGQRGPVEGYFPGAEYADLVTMDIYGEFKQDYYESMLALAAGNRSRWRSGQAAEPRGFGAAAALVLFHGLERVHQEGEYGGTAKAVFLSRGR